jgi:hypothetical protein
MATLFPYESSGNKDDFNFFTLNFGSVLNAHSACWSIIGVYYALQFLWALQYRKLLHWLMHLLSFITIVLIGRTALIEYVKQQMKRVDASDVELPLQLIDAGHHFDDIPENQRRGTRRQSNIILPLTLLLLHKVVESDMTRPIIKRRK